MKEYGKTLRELLASVPFDDLVPFMPTDGNSRLCPAPFKEAFDILLHTDSGSIEPTDINVHRSAADNGEYILKAPELEGRPWEECIDGNILLEEGPDVNPAQLAFAILWHLTFYGYNERTKKDAYRRIMFGDRPDNKYGRLAFEAEIKRDFLLADRNTRRDILQSVTDNEEEGGMSYSLTEKQWKEIEYHRSHCNGTKRKRDARLSRRIERFDRLTVCERTIQDLLNGQKETSITRDDLSFLIGSEKRCGREFQTRSFDISSRLQYVSDLIRKYGAADLDSPVSNAAVRIATNHNHPLSDTERYTITNLIKEAVGLDSLTVCIAEDDFLDKEIFIMIVGAIA